MEAAENDDAEGSRSEGAGEGDRLRLFWELFFKAETGTYEKSTWLDLFLAEFLLRVGDGADPKDLIKFCPVSGVVTLVGCELLCGIHRVTSAINAQYSPPPTASTPPTSAENTPTPAGLFSRAHAQSSSEILRKYLLSGVAWRCLLLLKMLGVEGLSCCRQLSSVLIWLCGELGGAVDGPPQTPNPFLPAPTPQPPIHQLFSHRIWCQRPGTDKNTHSRVKRASHMKVDTSETSRRKAYQESEDTSDSGSDDDLQALNRSLGAPPSAADFQYFESPAREPAPHTMYCEPFQQRKNKPKADEYTTERHRAVLSSELSAHEFTLLVTALLRALCGADSALAGAEGSLVSMQCVNFALRNLCALQDAPASASPPHARLALAELLVVSLDKALQHAELCAKLVGVGVLPMLLQLLESAANDEHDQPGLGSEEGIALARYVFGIAYSALAFLHCLLQQSRSVEKLQEFAEQFRLFADSLRGAALQRCVAVVLRVGGTDGEVALLARRLAAGACRLVRGMKRVRAEVSHRAACSRTRHKSCAARVAAGAHHHHALLAPGNACAPARLYKSLLALLGDERAAAAGAVRAGVLRALLRCGACCCVSPAVVMEAAVRLALRHGSAAPACLRLLERSVYGELGAAVLAPRARSRLPCAVCEAGGGGGGEGFSFLVHYNSLLQLDNRAAVLAAAVGHLRRAAPRCRPEVRHELLFAVAYPTFIVAKHRYAVRGERAAHFLTASCLGMFAALLDSVRVAEEFARRGGLSYVLELVSLPEFARPCCAILEIAVAVETRAERAAFDTGEGHGEVRCAASMFLSALAAATDDCLKMFRLKLTSSDFVTLSNVSSECGRLGIAVPVLGEGRAGEVRGPVAAWVPERSAVREVEAPLEAWRRAWTFWRSAAALCGCSPVLRRRALGARALSGGLALLKLSLREVLRPASPPPPQEPRLLVQIIEALLTVHLALTDVTSGRSKEISCELLRAALVDAGIGAKDTINIDLTEIKTQNNDESKDALNIGVDLTKRIKSQKKDEQTEVVKVELDGTDIQITNDVTSGKDPPYNGVEVNKDQVTSKEVIRVTKEDLVQEEESALQALCDALVRAATRSHSPTHVMPPLSKTKLPSLAASPAPSPAGSSSDTAAVTGSDSEPIPPPTARDDGYEADVEARSKLAGRSRLSSRNDSSLDFDDDALPTPDWAECGVVGSDVGTGSAIAHPELCLIVIDILTQVVKSIMEVRSSGGTPPRASFSLARACCARLCAALARAPSPPAVSLLGPLLNGTAALLTQSDDALEDLQRSVLELFHVLASTSISPRELVQYLALFRAPKPPLTALLGALRRLARTAQPSAPRCALTFPVTPDLDAADDQVHPGHHSSSSQQAELFARKIREQHLSSGVWSCWSRAAARCVAEAGWAAWLQGFALVLWLRAPPATNARTDVPATGDPWDSGEEWKDETQEKDQKDKPRTKQDDTEGKRAAHVVSIGHEALMLETWLESDTGSLVFRLSRGGTGAGPTEGPAPSARCAGALSGAARWSCVGLHVQERLHKRRAYIQVTVYVDGYQFETVSLPVQGILIRKPSPAHILIGECRAISTSLGAPGGGAWHLASLVAYRAPVLDEYCALYRAALGPSASPLGPCQVDNQIPNYAALLTPELLDSNIDWDQVFELSGAAVSQLQERLLLSFSAHSPHEFTLYHHPPSNVFSSRLGGGAGGALGGGASPESLPARWSGSPLASRRSSLGDAVHTLGGADLMLCLMARVYDLNGGDACFASALGTLLRLCRVEPRLHPAIFTLPALPHSPHTLQVLFAEACSSEVITVRDTDRGPHVTLLARTNAAVLQPELLLFDPDMQLQECTWEIDLGGGLRRSATGSLWALALRGVEALLGAEHPRRAFNRYQLERASMLQHLLLSCKERFLISEHGPLEPECQQALVALSRSLLDQPPAPHHAALLADLLLLMHQASDTFVTHSRGDMYFLLSTEAPEPELSFLQLVGRRKKNAEKEPAGQEMKDMSSSATSEELAEKKVTDKETKGILNMQIKEGRKNNVSTSVSENSDGTLEDSSEAGDADVGQGGIEGPIEGEGEGSLSEYIVVDVDDVHAAGEMYGGMYQQRALRTGANPGWEVCEGFAMLLHDVISSMTHQQASCAVQAEVLIVLARHRSARVRAGCVRALCALMRRAPDPRRAPRSPLLPVHLANQISLFDASRELVEACAMLITQLDAPLEDQLLEDTWRGIGEEQLQMCPPLLALLPRCLHDSSLALETARLLNRVAEKASLKTLSEVAFAEVVVRTARDVRDDALLSAVVRLLAAMACKALAAPHAMQTVNEIHYLLTYATLRASNEASRASCREAHCLLLQHELDFLEDRLHASYGAKQTNYFTTVLSSAVSLTSGTSAHTGSTEGAGRTELASRHRALLARGVQLFLMRDSEAPLGPSEDAAFDRLAATLVSGMSSSSSSSARWWWGGGSGGAAAEATTLLLELASWSLSPRPAALPTAPRLLARLYRLPSPPAAPTHHDMDAKLSAYVLTSVARAHALGSLELAITDWARGWAHNLACALPERPRAAALHGAARAHAAKDAQRWARTARSNAPHIHKAVFRWEAHVRVVAEGALAATRRVVELQNSERKAFLQQLRAAAAARARDARTMTALRERFTHERGPWHFPSSAASSWALDATEGPGRVRVRLRRAHLRVQPRLLKPNHRYKAESADKPPPLVGWAAVGGDGLGGRRPPLSPRLGAAERVGHMARVTYVQVARDTPGELLLTDRALHFVPEDPPEPEPAPEPGSRAARRAAPTFDPAPPLTWPLDLIRGVATRRWCLRERAVELFLGTGHAHLLAFHAEHEREAFLRALRDHRVPLRNEAETLAEATNQWRQGAITNWEYLMRLNDLAGRTYNDLMQYPVLPFVVADYTSKILDLNDPASFRDLAKPMAVQDKSREQHYINTFNDLAAARASGTAGAVPGAPHHYASLYSNSGAVLHFLVRLPPFTQLFLSYQDNNFDMPDRTFHSLATTWRLITKDSPTDVKELIPELFYLPELLCNHEGLNLGVRQCGAAVEDVELPGWAGGDARLFTLVHRQALEAARVSQRLPLWLDLVLGYKQTGAAAKQAINVFPECTYYGFDPSTLEDEVERTAAEAMIRTYGQAPRRLFTKAHPVRTPLLPTLTDEPSSPPEVWSGVIGAQWGNYCGSPALGAPTLAARVVAPAAARLQALPALRTVAALPANTLVLLTADGTASAPAGGLALSSLALVWCGAEGTVRARRRQQPRPQLVLHQPPPADHRITVMSSSCLVAGCPVVVGAASGRVLVLRAHPGAAGGAGPLFRSRALPLLAHDAAITDVHVCTAQGVLATASEDGIVVLWDLNELTYIRTLPNRGMLPVTHVTISETLCDVATVHDLTRVPATGVASELDDDSYERDRERHASLIRVHTVNAAPVGSVKVAERVTCVCYSHAPEGVSVNCVVVGLDNGSIRLYSSWDLRPVAAIAPAGTGPLLSICYSRCGALLLGCYSEGQVAAWEASGSTASRTQPVRVLTAGALL